MIARLALLLAALTGSPSALAAAPSPAPKASEPEPAPLPPPEPDPEASSGASSGSSAGSPPAEAAEASAKRRPPPPKIRPDPATAPVRPPDAAALGLERQDDGTYDYVDPYKRFSARIERDGTISFADRWRRPTATGNRQHGALGGLPRGLFGPMGMQVTGPSEWMMALSGVDRDARVKAELLAATRELRTQMAIAWHLGLLERRLGELERDLDAILADRSLTPAARRALLFQRWDECDEAYQGPLGEIPEDAITTIDDARRDTAERARRTIEAFVARRLPPGRKDSFTARELQDLNGRRQSRQPFAPYARGAAAQPPRTP